MDRLNRVAVVRRLPKYVSWLFLSLAANAGYLAAALTDSLTGVPAAVLVVTGLLGVLVFLVQSARELARLRAEFGHVPGH